MSAHLYIELLSSVHVMRTQIFISTYGHYLPQLQETVFVSIWHAPTANPLYPFYNNQV